MASVRRSVCLVIKADKQNHHSRADQGDVDIANTSYWATVHRSKYPALRSLQPLSLLQSTGPRIDASWSFNTCRIAVRRKLCVSPADTFPRHSPCSQLYATLDGSQPIHYQWHRHAWRSDASFTSHVPDFSATKLHQWLTPIAFDALDPYNFDEF